jgi:hypothetical protein
MHLSHPSLVVFKFSSSRPNVLLPFVVDPLKILTPALCSHYTNEPLSFRFPYREIIVLNLVRALDNIEIHQVAKGLSPSLKNDLAF